MKPGIITVQRDFTLAPCSRNSMGGGDGQDCNHEPQDPLLLHTILRAKMVPWKPLLRLHLKQL